VATYEVDDTGRVQEPPAVAPLALRAVEQPGDVLVSGAELGVRAPGTVQEPGAGPPMNGAACGKPEALELWRRRLGDDGSPQEVAVVEDELAPVPVLEDRWRSPAPPSAPASRRGVTP
jgi:hypothetical protein